LVSGFRNYVRFQYFMWYSILISFGIMLVLFFINDPVSAQGKLNGFAATVDGTRGFFGAAKAAAADAGVNFTPPFWLFGTLMVAPIAWTSLQWATYSVEQGGEIKNAHVFRNQLFILVGSLALTALLLILLAVGMGKAMGNEGILVASSGYWLGVPEATIGGTFLMPNMLAIALTGSPIIVGLIGLGYILNSFQIVCNCYIGTTRIMVAQGLDGLLPEWFSRVHPRWRTPVNAHVAYFLGSVLVIFLFNLVGDWSTKWALGVTLANGAVFVASALAAALLPYRATRLYEASPGAGYALGGVPLVTVLGTLGTILGGFMLWAFLFVDDLGLAYSGANPVPYGIVLGTILFGVILYWIMRQLKARQGIKVEFAFAEIPPE
jgi:amino acid transporter